MIVPQTSDPQSSHNLEETSIWNRQVTLSSLTKQRLTRWALTATTEHSPPASAPTFEQNYTSCECLRKCLGAEAAAIPADLKTAANDVTNVTQPKQITNKATPAASA